MRTLWLLLFSVVAAGWARGQSTPVIALGEFGSRLPAFSVMDLQGHAVSSADLRGKVVLIDFWATWCQPRKKEMPGYQSLLNRYGRRGFAVVGFKFDTMPDSENPISFANKMGVHYPLAVASDDLQQSSAGFRGCPPPCSMTVTEYCAKKSSALSTPMSSNPK